MSTLSSATVTDVNLVLKERTHMRLCLNMLIFTHNLGNWLMTKHITINDNQGHWVNGHWSLGQRSTFTSRSIVSWGRVLD